jgi:hypothetical protein
VSVDGLSVINGRPASGHRPYLIEPSGSVRIRGWRRASNGRDLRFQSRDKSYASLMGHRNVGVIGLFAIEEAAWPPSPARSVAGEEGCGGLGPAGSRGRRRHGNCSRDRFTRLLGAICPQWQQADLHVTTTRWRPCARRACRWTVHPFGRRRVRAPSTAPAPKVRRRVRIGRLTIHGPRSWCGRQRFGEPQTAPQAVTATRRPRRISGSSTRLLAVNQTSLILVPDVGLQDDSVRNPGWRLSVT